MCVTSLDGNNGYVAGKDEVEIRVQRMTPCVEIVVKSYKWMVWEVKKGRSRLKCQVGVGRFPYRAVRDDNVNECIGK